MELKSIKVKLPSLSPKKDMEKEMDLYSKRSKACKSMFNAIKADDYFEFQDNLSLYLEADCKIKEMEEDKDEDEVD